MLLSSAVSSKSRICLLLVRQANSDDGVTSLSRILEACSQHVVEIECEDRPWSTRRHINNTNCPLVIVSFLSRICWS